MSDIFRETFRGFIRVHILHHAAKERVYGAEMIEELREHGYAMSPGTLYPLLHALEERGLLRSAGEVVDGRVRRYYRCTAAGVKALKSLKVKLRELTEEVLGEPSAQAPKPPQKLRQASLGLKRTGRRRSAA
ncbi:MAG: PadR family transcriptional regulator [Burkholderiaceae bacterium]|jgi:DNA-binding PadR family transcriptional regulator|nr:PadR family transcriptional regulator [Burkholderiaceae bacterium]